MLSLKSTSTKSLQIELVTKYDTNDAWKESLVRGPNLRRRFHTRKWIWNGGPYPLADFDRGSISVNGFWTGSKFAGVQIRFGSGVTADLDPPRIWTASGYGPPFADLDPPIKLSFSASFVSYLVVYSICKLFCRYSFQSQHNISSIKVKKKKKRWKWRFIRQRRTANK